MDEMRREKENAERVGENNREQAERETFVENAIEQENARELEKIADNGRKQDT